ncbi:MAG: hypothetical protein HYX92_08310 [Chloroflexi bacterium]|nr:hypothetical protein [Chloroflexota bacterium]
MAQPTFEVVWPLGKSAYEPMHLAHRGQDLEGSTICELWEWMFRGDEIFPMLRELLSKRYSGIKFVDYNVFGDTHGPKEREVIAALPELLRKHKCDAVISGVGA